MNSTWVLVIVLFTPHVLCFLGLGGTIFRDIELKFCVYHDLHTAN